MEKTYGSSFLLILLLLRKRCLHTKQSSELKAMMCNTEAEKKGLRSRQKRYDHHAISENYFNDVCQNKVALFQLPLFKIPSFMNVLSVVTAKCVKLRCKV